MVSINWAIIERDSLQPHLDLKFAFITNQLVVTSLKGKYASLFSFLLPLQVNPHC